MTVAKGFRLEKCWQNKPVFVLVVVVLVGVVNLFVRHDCKPGGGGKVEEMIAELRYRSCTSLKLITFYTHLRHKLMLLSLSYEC